MTKKKIAKFESRITKNEDGTVTIAFENWTGTYCGCCGIPLPLKELNPDEEYIDYPDCVRHPGKYKPTEFDEKLYRYFWERRPLK